MSNLIEIPYVASNLRVFGTDCAPRGCGQSAPPIRAMCAPNRKRDHAQLNNSDTFRRRKKRISQQKIRGHYEPNASSVQKIPTYSKNVAIRMQPRTAMAYAVTFAKKVYQAQESTHIEPSSWEQIQKIWLILSSICLALIQLPIEAIQRFCARRPTYSNGNIERSRFADLRACCEYRMFRRRCKANNLLIEKADIVFTKPIELTLTYDNESGFGKFLSSCKVYRMRIENGELKLHGRGKLFNAIPISIQPVLKLYKKLNSAEDYQRIVLMMSTMVERCLDEIYTSP